MGSQTRSQPPGSVKHPDFLITRHWDKLQLVGAANGRPWSLNIFSRQRIRSDVSLESVKHKEAIRQRNRIAENLPAADE